jgi:hypothetical protein
VLNKEGFRKSFKKMAKYTSPTFLSVYTELQKCAPSLYDEFSVCHKLLTLHGIEEVDPGMLRDQFDSAPVSASWVLGLAAVVIGFVFFVLEYAEPLQLWSGEVTTYLQRHLTSEEANMLSMHFHHRFSSMFWSYSCAFIFWRARYSGSRTDRLGAHCFFITTVSFVVKSLVKNFLRVCLSFHSFVQFLFPSNFIF